MEVYRLSRKKYKDSLSGIGAAIRGGRWNSIGTEIIYCGSNRSLCMAEVAVHLTLSTLPDDYYMLTIFIPDRLMIEQISEVKLPRNWSKYPPNKFTQRIGTTFIRDNNQCILQVPSAVTRGDYNILINPNHHLFEQIRIIDKEPFPFDMRIFHSQSI
ncbi:MAG: RES family NAD+ phosphorylase [Saprospiraceae bacterium]